MLSIILDTRDKFFANLQTLRVVSKTHMPVVNTRLVDMARIPTAFGKHGDGTEAIHGHLNALVTLWEIGLVDQL